MKPQKLDSTKYDLFIFDWDGTLNNMRLTLRMNEAFKRAFGLWNRDSTIKDFKRVDYELKRKLRSEEMRIDLLTSMFELLLNFSRPKLHNDTLALLMRLRRKRKKIALFTNGRSQRIVRELKILHIDGYFDSIVSARELHALKPNPTGLKAILSSLKVKPERSLYAGDMVDDIITAKWAKVRSCAIADGFDSYHKLKSIHPDYIFHSIEQMTRAL